MDGLKTDYMKEELENEKAELNEKIAAKQKEIADATTSAYWLRKRVKLIDSQIKAMGEPATEENQEK